MPAGLSPFFCERRWQVTQKEGYPKEIYSSKGSPKRRRLTQACAAMYDLYIANKNYSSWSLRAWVLMKELGVPFTEHLLRFGDSNSWRRFAAISPSGRVPCLVNGATSVWDSLAIAEYLAELHAGVWPADRTARAFARSAAAEMHSGFSEIRTRCPMSCGVRIRPHGTTTALLHELERIEALWRDGLSSFGGPFLAGASFTAVDAFFAPVAFRVQTYGLALSANAAEYVAHLLSLRAMRAWYADALQEKFRHEPHEKEILPIGDLIEDLRGQESPWPFRLGVHRTPPATL